MSGSSEVLQEYLVKLGFKVNPADVKKFNGSLTDIEKKVLGVGFAVAGVVAGIEAAAAAFAYSMRRVYFDSKLADSSVKNLQSLEYAGKQFGVTAESMGGAIHNMAQQLRLNPGLRGLIESFGVKVEGRDVSDVATDYVRALDKMPEFQASQFAGMFGMDPDTYHLLRGHIDELIAKQKEMKDAQAAIGLDMDKAAAQSKHYADSIDNLQMHFEGLTSVVLGKTAPAFDYLVDKLNKDMDENAKNISKNGLVSTGVSNIVHAWTLPFRLEGEAFDWIKNGMGMRGDGKPSTAAERSTGVLPVPGGHLGATIGSPGAPTGASTSSTLAQLEAQYGLPAGMLSRVYQIESASGKNPNASRKGALGPFQFMQGTGTDWGLSTDADRMDFGKSSTAAAKYLHSLLAHFGGDSDKALAGYNWGPGNVDKFGLSHLPSETAGYLAQYHALAGGMTVTNTFGIAGTNSADIADKVAGAQSRVMADALRNGQGAVR